MCIGALNVSTWKNSNLTISANAETVSDMPANYEYAADWEAGDLFGDDQLSVFDLCLMKRELIAQKSV